MKFKYTSVTLIIILLGGFSLSYGSDSREDGDCTSCVENYEENMGAVCCDQSVLSCSTLEATFDWNCTGCECADEADFVSRYGCTDPSAANYEGATESYGTCWYPELEATGGITEISLDWEPYGTICADQDACNTEKSSLTFYGEDDPHNGYGPNRFMRQAKNGEDILLFGEGEERRDHVWIEDVAELICRVLCRQSTGTLNIATGTVVSFRDIAELSADLFSSVSKIIGSERSGPMPHNGYRAFDPSASLGSFPDFIYKTLAEGLEKTYCSLTKL